MRGIIKLYKEKVFTDRYGQIRDCSIRDSKARTALLSQFYGRCMDTEKRNIERFIHTWYIDNLKKKQS